MSKEKESIRLEDFINDAIIALKLDKEDIPQPEDRIKLVCPKCKMTYWNDDKFCSVDGTEIVEEKYEVQSDDYESFVRDIFYDFSESGGTPESLPYEFVDSIEKRGDGSGYYMNFIFKRKSDGKFFYYTSYDGRVENDRLYETTKEVTIKWDFENRFD